MLRQILARLSEGGTWTIADLAAELETTPQLVEAALEELARHGYLKQVGVACRGTCASCSLSGGCVPSAGERVWTLA